MPDIDPIHWACVALGLLLAAVVSIGGTMYWKQGEDLKVCLAEAQSFSAGVEAKGLQAQLDKERTENELRQAAVNIQGDLNAKQSELDQLYATSERLRLAAKAGASSRENASLAAAASAVECPSARAGLADRLEQLDLGVRARLLKSRDETITTLNGCKTYVKKLTDIVNRHNQELTP